MADKTVIPDRKDQLRMNVEAYRAYLKEIKESPKNMKTEEEMSGMYLELSEKKDLYRNLTSEGYVPPIDVLEKDKIHLESIFNKLNCSNWSHNFGWVGQAKTPLNAEAKQVSMPAELYEGLKTRKLWSTDGQPPAAIIAGIDIEGVGAHGTFPKDIAKVTTCRLLKMNWNIIKGNLPSNMNEMEFLEHVLLSGNMLHGNLDENIFSNMAYLTEIDLSFNQFSGELPNHFDTCENLVSFNVSGNQFVGNIPSSLGNHKKLKELIAYSNDFSGELPRIFTTDCVLEVINLSNNKFTGSIDCFCSCANLARLQLSNNKLDQRLPNAIGNMKALKVLHLQNNNITGELPDGLSELTHMDNFNIANNQITGRLPSFIGNWTGCRIFMCTGNDIKGPVPRSVSRMINLKDFHIFESYPCDDCYLNKAYTEKCFDRVYRWGTSVGVDHVHWREDEIWGPGGRYKGYHGMHARNHGFYRTPEEDEEIQRLMEEAIKRHEILANGFDDDTINSDHHDYHATSNPSTNIRVGEGAFETDNYGQSHRFKPDQSQISYERSFGMHSSQDTSLHVEGSLHIDHDPSLETLSQEGGKEGKQRRPQEVTIEQRLQQLPRLGQDSQEIAELNQKVRKQEQRMNR